MTKPDKTTKSQSPFKGFETLTKALIAVPRKELQAKLDQHQRRKEKKQSLQHK
jgi:hypothetical protein